MFNFMHHRYIHVWDETTANSGLTLQVQLRGKRLAFVFISTTDALQRVVFDRRRFDETSALGFPTKGPLCPCDLLMWKRHGKDKRKVS